MENKPLTIKPSLSIMCNRRCGFCGINRVDYNYIKSSNITKHMSIEIAEGIAKEVGTWLKDGVRFELGGFGEPLLNKDAIKIVGLIRKYNPKSQVLMYTNQSVLDEDKIEDLFDSGLNILFIDSYTKKDVLEAKNLIENNMYDSVVYEESTFNPYRRGSVKRKIICHQDYSNPEGSGYNKRSKQLHNAAGNIDDRAYEIYNIKRVIRPLEKMCVRPFRELVILPDGIIPICCQDWCRDLIVEKFPERGLEKIWDGVLLNLIRARLYSRKRDFSPCCMCNHISSMVGLVPKPKLEDNNSYLKNLITTVNEGLELYKLKKTENRYYKGNIRSWIESNC